MTTRLASIALLATLAACASPPTVPTARFANAPIANIVDDRRDVPKAPKSRLFLSVLYIYDGAIGTPLMRVFELPRTRRALGTNALDEVPDSTWFTNRIGIRALTPDEIRIGPVTDDPSKHKPWTVRSTKVGGNSIGFIIKDSTGVKYVIKFDDAENIPEMETGNDVVIDRLLWAAGYNVAEDQVAYFKPSELVLAKDAMVKDVTGTGGHKLTRKELDALLAKVHHDKDGQIRTLMSRWIDGKTIGGHASDGVRHDDPNDRIPHQLRRDLRGQSSIYAWLDAVDVTEGQFVDTWKADASDPKRHYVVHYAIDFGQSLGGMASTATDWWRAHAYQLDFAQMLRQLVTLGLTSRPWQERGGAHAAGVSPMFDVVTFDPGTWHTDLPTYGPFRDADRFDKFWGAKIVARFTRPQIRAAVEAGRFTDPKAVDDITDTLIARQGVTEAYWFARVNPLDRFATATSPSGTELCFEDLALTHELASAADTRYGVTLLDYDGRVLLPRFELAANPSGSSCAQLALAPRGDGYTIVRIDTARPRFTGTTFVHLAADPATHAARVIGVWRD